MSEEEILAEAKAEVSNLVDRVLEEIYDLAFRCNYEPEWVFEQFRADFSGRKPGSYGRK